VPIAGANTGMSVPIPHTVSSISRQNSESLLLTRTVRIFRSGDKAPKGPLGQLGPSAVAKCVAASAQPLCDMLMVS
jgi:hypothetical protein